MDNKWDLRFLHLAREVSHWSKDPSTQTGAVIADGKNVVSIGYNGFPANMLDTPEQYENRELKYDKIIHCEMNAVLTASRPVRGLTLYTWPFASCTRCAVHMVQAGIVRCVAPKLPKHLEERWKDNLERTKKYFNEAGVELVEYDIDFTQEYWSL